MPFGGNFRRVHPMGCSLGLNSTRRKCLPEGNLSAAARGAAFSPRPFARRYCLLFHLNAFSRTLVESVNLPRDGARRQARLHAKTQREHCVRCASKRGVERQPFLNRHPAYASPKTEASVAREDLRLLRSKLA